MATLLVGALLQTPPPSLHLRSQLSSSQSEFLGISFSHPRTTSLALSAVSPRLSPIVCGRGDKKTAKGKRFRHSFGNSRPRNKTKGRGPPRIPVPAAPQKADPIANEEVDKTEIDESLS